MVEGKSCHWQDWALGQPNLLEVASPFLGALSVTVSGLLSLAVLLALVLLVRDARPVPTVRDGV